jgi:putative ABC transport system substrate-binding protein
VSGGPASKAAKDATPSIPIVTYNAGDVVATGLVPRLDRPGGNVTGMNDQSMQLSAKRLELLKAVVPRAARVAVVWNADDVAMSLRREEIDKASIALGVTISP